MRISESEPTIIDSLVRFLERFVFLKDKSLYQLISLWVVSTHNYQLFDYTGYIFAHSIKSSSGKSRLLEVLNLLVYKPSGLLISPTEAGIFRTAHDTTQLVDELDSLPTIEYLRSVLNAGFQKGGAVTRMEYRDGEYESVRFPVFAPRALAGINREILNQTTLDRTFDLEMVRQTKEEKREKFRPRKLTKEVEKLRDQIELFWILNEDKVAQLYDGEFPLLKDFRDRTIDIAEPLAAILEVAYKDHPQLEEKLQTFLGAISITRNDQQKEIKEHGILRELTRLAEEENPLVGNSTELGEICSNLPSKPSRNDISQTLRKYGFKTKSIRKGGVPKHRYVLHYEELADLIERYVS
ncbi:MAG: DUF3631 domain-containing protein, partial [Acidobacteria bacterium]|nr:DUF3631 domain-containing protein [Acidobacteriota bacterium]